MGKSGKSPAGEAPLSKKEQYRRFAKSARKAGLLVTRKTFDLVFREQLSPKTKGQ
jgi:hypothetical protein